jgi:hypothetical protein
MSGGLDLRVRELCSQIVSETDNAKMLKLVTELNRLLQRSAGQLEPDATTVAAE